MSRVYVHIYSAHIQSYTYLICTHIQWHIQWHAVIDEWHAHIKIHEFPTHTLFIVFKNIYACICIYASMHDYVYIIIHECMHIFIHTHMHMGWLQLVGSLKWQVSFTEYSLFYRALLKKRPTILGSLLIVATPYHMFNVSCAAVL